MKKNTPGEEVPKKRSSSKDCENYKKMADEYLAGWKRCQADAANAKKDDDRKRTEYILFAEEGIIRELLPIVDIFDRAFAGQDIQNPYVQGFRHIHTGLMHLLTTHGVTPIEAEGLPLDVSRHEAIESVPVNDEQKDNIITEELSKGYMLRDKVIQASKVKVGIYKKSS
ncbi:MAG: nucleotide exchange factor GrpE [Candidatus Ryanbacteria bacterium CG10_big_fil_rev_8_21_14_0_10_43_42]|uniref:Protein GrpE n=1 Tax=Candidatus Ryanbacteria bacterium CG10_big_fil_rev_8_21_14_0_10_43_42 TaxID=1974864 RepID=A0A2M8KX47_9BACT|nr:MAG: nucleotide exchange factor GrpE [Candidatus Ryanbacteria bacterium CG10_big_fil_rev_8_21_14_0_10_43_42]